MQSFLKKLVTSPVFQGGVIVLIIVNAIILGAETLDGVHSRIGAQLELIDHIILYAFVFEVVLRFAAEPRNYFRSGWNIFDFLIVFVSFFAASSGLAAVRALRVLRVLRVITIIPRMRVVVSALLDAIPGITSVGVVLVLIIYVFAVIAANIYGAEHANYFGDVFLAMYTLFQVMTLEGWPDIARDVGSTHPRSWIFFVTFLLIATFTMLNLFVAIVVRVVEEDSDAIMSAQTEAIRLEIRALRDEIRTLSTLQKRDPD